MRTARIRVLILAMTDMAWLGGIVMLVAFLYQLMGGEYYLTRYWQLWPMLAVYVICNGFIRLYHGNFFYPGAALSPVEEMRRLVFSISLTFLLLFAYLVLTRSVAYYSRFVLVVSWAATCAWSTPGRDLVRILMKKFRIGQIPVLIAGAGQTGTRLAQILANDWYFGFRVVGFLDDDLKKFPRGQEPKILGRLSNARRTARKYHVDYLICCLPLPVVQRQLSDYSRIFRHLTIIPDNQVFPVSWSYPVNLQGIAGIELRNQLLLPAPRIFKNLSELAISVVAILLFIPLFLVLALLVKLTSKGAVFYRARRLGVNGKPMLVWKFRTMYEDADDKLEKLLEENPDMAVEWRHKFKLENDPRVTPFGRFLRRTSMDELPQLFNVLSGEMAIIGPRPIVEQEKHYYGENYKTICQVKPGMTGLWQVSGRSETSYERRVMLDMYYIMNWSFWQDLYILERTVFEVIRCRGAR